MYELRDASTLTDVELREVLKLLTTLAEGESLELVTGTMIEMKNGAVFLDYDDGPLTIADAFRKITGGRRIESAQDEEHAVRSTATTRTVT